jgi:O-6-methylguanine DNA methyltransferase
MQEKILAYLQTIPRGKVVTYGQIASQLGNPKLARAVGNALHRNPDGETYPCYKVVSAQGKLSAHYAFGGLAAQQRRLEQDGITVTDNRVDLSKYQWKSE